MLFSPDVTNMFLLNIMEYIHYKEAYLMKVVVIRSPKLLAGIFRAIFRIKKEEQEQENEIE